MITLPTDFINWEWYHDEGMVRLFLHLLLRGGCFATSLQRLHDETGLTIRTLRTCLSRLERSGIIEMHTTHRSRLIVVKDYDRYEQKSDKQNDKPSDKQLAPFATTANGCNSDDCNALQTGYCCEGDKPSDKQSDKPTNRTTNRVTNSKSGLNGCDVGGYSTSKGGQRQTERQTEASPPHTPPLNNIYIYPSSSSRAREENFLQDLKKSDSTREKIAVALHIDQSEINAFADDFFNECTAKDIQHRNEHDFRTHFYNWLRIHIQYLQRYGKNDKRRGTEVMATSAADYGTTFPT